jgi:tetratricopeptide (TPR) repeat protein
MTGERQYAGRLSIAMFLLALGVLFATGCARAEESPSWRKAFAAGKTALAKGDLARAEERLVAALELAEGQGASRGDLDDVVGQLRGVYLAMSEKAPSWKDDLAAGREAIANGKVLEAQVRLTRALERAEAAKVRPGEVAGILDQLGVAWLAGGERDKSEAALRRALKLREDAQGPDSPDIAVTLKHLAALAEKAGDRKGALDLLERAVRLRSEGLGPGHPEVADSLIDLGAFHDAAGENARAEELYLRALGILEKAYGKDDPRVADALSNLIALYRKTGREEEARRLEKRYAEIEKRREGH